MDLYKTDPEFAERFAYFAFTEVPNEENEQLEERTRYMAILATLIGCGGLDAYREMLLKALENGVTPVVVKEIVYQATDYLGMAECCRFSMRPMNYYVKEVSVFPLKDRQQRRSMIDLKKV